MKQNNPLNNNQVDIYFRLEIDLFIEILIFYNVKLNDIKVIADIGACDGQDSLKLKELLPHAEVYALEGLKSHYREYLQNLSEIRAFNIVISNSDGYIRYFETYSEGVHGIYQSKIMPLIKTHKLPCRRFDTFSREKKLKVPDLVKIDVEGAAYEVLEGFGDLLEQVKVIQVETETVPWFTGQKTQTEVFDFLKSRGFLHKFMLKCIKGQFDSIFINSGYEKTLPAKKQSRSFEPIYQKINQRYQDTCFPDELK